VSQGESHGSGASASSEYPLAENGMTHILQLHPSPAMTSYVSSTYITRPRLVFILFIPSPLPTMAFTTSDICKVRPSLFFRFKSFSFLTITPTDPHRNLHPTSGCVPRKRMWCRLRMSFLFSHRHPSNVLFFPLVHQHPVDDIGLYSRHHPWYAFTLSSCLAPR